MKTKIYIYFEDTSLDLPTEDVWLKEDYPLASYQDGKAVATDRNHEEYECDGAFGRKYTRVKFERLYTLKYHRYPSIEEFLIKNPDTEVLYHRGYFFMKTWMD